MDMVKQKFHACYNIIIIQPLYRILGIRAWIRWGRLGTRRDFIYLQYSISSIQFYLGLTPQVGDDGQTDDNSVCSALDDLDNRFSDLHQKIRNELVAGHVDTSNLLSNLTLLPLKLKKEYDKPIQEILPELKEQKSINELFYRLNPLLSFLDYALLEHIINKFGSDQLKKAIEAYGSDIQVFMQQTTIQQLIDHLPGQPEIPQSFELMKTKICKDAKKCTIAEINHLRRRLCCEIRLSEIVFHIIALEDSNSFIVSFIVPSVLLLDVFESARKLDDSFFQRESIAYIFVGNRWVYHHKLQPFGDQLKERYQQSLVSVSPSELIPSPTKKIFRLAMIQRERVQQGQIQDAFVRMSVSGKVDDILRSKIPVELKDILRSTFHGGEIVLVEGAPGSGKSTFTIHICKKWGRGELFEQFSVVILVQLRDPAVQRAKSIADLLPCQDIAVAQEYASEIIATNGRGILWVLDGWDELPPHLQQDSIFRSLLPQERSDAAKLGFRPTLSGSPFRDMSPSSETSEEPSLNSSRSSSSLSSYASFNSLDELNIDTIPNAKYNSRFLYESSVIVTSRPISSGDLHPVVSSRIEVLGFTPEEQRQYFTECLKGDSQALGALLQKIKENPVVQSICYLPLNAAFVVHTFKYKGQSLPSTVYEIYLSVITSIVSRHFIREGKGHDLPGELASLADLSRSRVAGKDFQRLCKMAHRGVMQNKVTFSSSEFPEGSSTLSLLQGIESFLEGGKSVFYNFLHLIIQEIMSAYHIATQLSDSEQVSQFQQLFNQPRFAAVFQFYSSITKLETPGIRDVVARMAKDYSKTRLVSLLRCLYEAQDPSLCLYVAEQLEYKLNLRDTSLSPLDCLSLSFFLFSVVSSDCKEVFVGLDSCHIGDLGVNCLTKYLQSSNIDHGVKVALNLRGNNIHEEGASYIGKMLCSNNIVEHLYLWHNPIGDTGASFISNAVRETTSLKTLNMCDCGITSQGAEELSRALAQNSSLEKLDIGQNGGVGDEGVRHIAEALEHNKQLNLALNLRNNNIHEEGASYIAKMLCSSNIVEHLYLSGNPIRDTGASFISNAVRETTSLKTLNMCACGITSQGAEELSRALPQNSSLEKLDIGGNVGVEDEGIRHIAEALEHNKQLKELWIGRCGVTDKGAAYLASALSVNNTLKMLHMGGGELTEDGLSKLTQTLSHNTGLIKLVVSRNLSSITKHYERRLNETREKVGLPPIEIEGKWLLCLLFA